MRDGGRHDAHMPNLVAGEVHIELARREHLGNAKGVDEDADAIESQHHQQPKDVGEADHQRDHEGKVHRRNQPGGDHAHVEERAGVGEGRGRPVTEEGADEADDAKGGDHRDVRISPHRCAAHGVITKRQEGANNQKGDAKVVQRVGAVVELLAHVTQKGVEARTAQHAHHAAEGIRAKDDEGPRGLRAVHCDGKGSAVGLDVHVAGVVLGDDVAREEPRDEPDENRDANKVGPNVDGFVVHAKYAGEAPRSGVERAVVAQKVLVVAEVLRNVLATVQRQRGVVVVRTGQLCRVRR